MAFITTIILRLEGCEERSDDQLEQVADPDLGIWIKDVDVLPGEQDKVFHYLEDIVNLASTIDHREKYVHLSLAEGLESFRLTPSLLRSLSDAGCVLEIEV